MIGRHCGYVGLTLVIAANLSAQGYERRAEMRGGPSGGGKCTIEVEVDGSAEIELFGDTGRIRTLSGQPSVWRRFICNEPIPRDPVDFRFIGVDGRGHVDLIRDPRSNRGRAVVRIDDPRGGREGYTFDLVWRGGGGFSGGGGFPGGGGPPRGGFGDRGPLENWDREVDFRGRGDGYFRRQPGIDDRLYDCAVRITRRGDISVTFQTHRRSELVVSGRITRMTGNRIVADVSGPGVVGAMEIRIDGRDRVREINMSGGSGRERFDLRWHN
jgi:hypothetical protein